MYKKRGYKNSVPKLTSLETYVASKKLSSRNFLIVMNYLFKTKYFNYNFYLKF